MKSYYYCCLLFVFVIQLAVAAKRELIDLVIEKKFDNPNWLHRHTRGEGGNTLDDNDNDPCQSLPDEETPPTARDVFNLENDDEDLVPTGIEIQMPDGSTISRLEHRAGRIPVWNSGAVVAQPRPIRGLCTGPVKLRGTSGPLKLRRNTRAADPINPTSVSVNTCIDHWQLDSNNDEIYENSTKVYIYQYDDASQTTAHEIDVRGLEYATNVPFRVFCLIDAKTNQVIKSWDGLLTYFGFGGNSKTSRYRYGDAGDPLHPQLPSVADNGPNTCLMQNAARTVVVYDLKSGSARITPGRTPVVSYSCDKGADDAINGAFGPLDDCFFNTNKTVQFLLDPEWGFSTDINKNSPVGVFRVGAHFNQRYDNAFWDGTAFYVGDGGSTFLPLCTCEDVVAHEIGHAVTQMTSDLIYEEEPGCMNEAFSDMMAEALEYYYRGTADFKIGTKCMKTRPFLRDMSVPMSFTKFTTGTDPHHCSAIFNYAFYKLANSPGWGMKHAWKVFLNANAAFWKKNTGMQQAACDVAVSATRYRIGGDRQHLINAFKAVDIDISGCMPAAPPPTQPPPPTTRPPTTPSRPPPPTTRAPITARPATVQIQTTTTLRTTTTDYEFTLPSWLTWLIPNRRPPTTTIVYTRATIVTLPTFTEPQTFAPPSPSADIGVIENCESVEELSANQGRALYFKVRIPAGATKINVFIDGLTGDADLYIKLGSPPTLTSYDYRPYWKGSSEWVRSTITTTQGEWFYIMIMASKTFDGLSLDACIV